MNAAPLVSVIIPAYNAQAFVGTTIESALAQTHQPLEVLVGDDASTDDTLKVLESFGDRIRIVSFKKNTGNSQLRNALIAASKGKYIAFLDHDDLWHREKIALQVAAMERNPQASLCHTGSEMFGDVTGIGPIGEDARDAIQGRCFEKLFRRNGVLISSAMVRRDLLPAQAFWPDLHGVRDYGLCMTLLFDHEAILLPQLLTQYRRHQTQLTARGERYLQINAAAARLRILEQFADRIDPTQLAWWKEWALNELHACTYSFYWRGEHDLALRGFDLLKQHGRYVPFLQYAKATVTRYFKNWTTKRTA